LYSNTQIHEQHLVTYCPEVMVRGGSTVFVINQITSDYLYNKTYSRTWH